MFHPKLLFSEKLVRFEIIFRFFVEIEVPVPWLDRDMKIEKKINVVFSLPVGSETAGD